MAEIEGLVLSDARSRRLGLEAEMARNQAGIKEHLAAIRTLEGVNVRLEALVASYVRCIPEPAELETWPRIP